MSDPRNRTIFDVKKKKFVKFLTKKGFVRSDVAKKLKNNPKAFKAPRDFVIDTKNKKLVSIKTKEGTINKNFKKIAQTRPNTLEFSNTQVYDFTNDTVNESKEYLTPKGRIKKKFQKDFILKGNVLVSRPTNINVNKVFTGIKKQKGGRVQRQIYRIDDYVEGTEAVAKITDVDPNIEQEDFGEQAALLTDYVTKFVETIKYFYMEDFSTEARNSAEKQRVLLRFGDIGDNELRFFDIADLDDLLEKIENWTSDNDYGGDEEAAADAVGTVNIYELNLDWFEINLQGLNLLSGNGFKEPVKSKYWACDQPKTRYNCCFDGALCRGLKLGKSYKTIRYNMIEKTYGVIKWGRGIFFDEIEYYENEYKCNIHIFEDSPHFDNDNAIRLSKKNYDREVKMLYKDEHYALIKHPKLRINDLSKESQIRNGVYKKPKQYIKNNIDNYEKKKKREEYLVIFDIETIFDKYDGQYLKPYGVSWVVWKKDQPFTYDENIHTKEPYCYYERGLGCLDKFVQFLVNSPEDKTYIPIGFNNSRFDNFAVCEAALNMGVLHNVFMCDGSILYCKVQGASNFWDASRFLVGQSLNGACKSYKTVPAKAPDLINHYEIQCYYEKFGIDGLVKLLDGNEKLVLYNKLDCLCLLDLVLKMRSSYIQLFDEDIFNFLTISSMGYKVQVKKWYGHEKEIKAIREDDTLDTKTKTDMISKFKPKFQISKAKNFKEDRFFRDSLTAGRTQSFYEKLDYKGELAMGDIKSLYPTVMGGYGDNHCPYPYGNYHYTKEYQKDKLGIYKVDINHQRCKWKNQEVVYEQFKAVEKISGVNLYREYAPNVIPLRVKDKPLQWFHKDKITDVNLTSVDIEVLKWATEDDNCVTVKEGYYWEDSRTDLFIDYLDPPRLEKTKQDFLKAEGSSEYNVALREGCKAVSNCLSGKLLEAIHEDVTKQYKSKEYSKMVRDDTIDDVTIQDFGGLSFITGKRSAEDTFNQMKEDKKKPSYLGMFVYSYARKLMYTKILGKYITLYMDTDSACMPYIEWLRLCKENEGKNFVDTGEYGCIEEEVCSKKHKADRLIAISPKNYAVINSKDESFSKRKFKGIRKSDYFIPLKSFGETTEEAKAKIRSMKQKDIRRIREFGCCVKCIDKVIKGEEKCIKCQEHGDNISKAYSTEMFEHLVKGEKIAVFCSMINKVRYAVSTVEQDMSNGLNNEYEISSKGLEYYIRDRKGLDMKQLVFDKEGIIKSSRALNCAFKLKQTYLIKII